MAGEKHSDDVFIKLEIVGTPTLIGKQISHSQSVSASPIEVTNKSANEATRFLSGQGEVNETIQLDVIFSNDAGFIALRDSLGSGTVETLHVVKDGFDDDIITGQVVSFNETSPDSDKVSASFSIKVAQDSSLTPLPCGKTFPGDGTFPVDYTNWSLQTSDDNDILLAVAGSRKTPVWVAGGASAYGVRSSDNGLTWTRILPRWLNSGGSIASENIQVIATDDDGIWMVAFNLGRAAKSVDDGVTWTALPRGLGGASPTTRNYNKIMSVGNNTWLAISNNELTRSIDNGSNWSIIVPQFNTSPIMVYAETDGKGTVIINGGANNFSRSTDFGATWSKISTPVISGKSVRDLAVTKFGKWFAQEGDLIGTDLLIESLSGGASWIQGANTAQIDLSVAFTNFNNTSLAMASDERFIYSEDDGQTWTDETASLPSKGAIGQSFDMDIGFANVTIIVADGQWIARSPGSGIPTANFTFVENNRSVQFTDTSSDADGTIVSWLWDFGDGTTQSTEQNPNHLYFSDATFNVILTVTDNDSKTGQVTIPVPAAINNLPIANFTQVVNGLQVTFTDASSDSDGTIVSWEWDFGDTATSTVQNPVHVYAGAGTFPVTLKVTDNEGGFDSVTINANPVNIVGPTADFTQVIVAGPDEMTYQFTDTSIPGSAAINAWNWDFNEVLGFSSLQNPQFTFLNAGIHNMSLEVTDANLLTDTKNLALNVGNPPTANWSQVATGLSVVFTDLSTPGNDNIQNPIVTWAWDFGDTNTSSVQNPTHVYASANTYSVSLTVTDSLGRQDTLANNVTVSSASVAGSVIYAGAGYNTVKPDFDLSGTANALEGFMTIGTNLKTSGNEADYSSVLTTMTAGKRYVVSADLVTTVPIEITASPDTIPLVDMYWYNSSGGSPIMFRRFDPNTGDLTDETGTVVFDSIFTPPADGIYYVGIMGSNDTETGDFIDGLAVT